MIRLVPPLLAVVGWVVGGGTTAAQQVVEIDYDAGRTIIDDPWRAIHWRGAISHERGELFVQDSEEPEGIMAFSLATGEHLRTYVVPTGGGPRELPEGLHGMSVAPNDRLYISGLVRVLEFDMEGEFLGGWTPNVPARFRGSVCDLGGQPAVPAVDGVVRRGTDGDEAIGENISPIGSDPGEWDTREEFMSMILRVQGAQILCLSNAAFVLSEYGDHSDSLAVYHHDTNREGRLQIPVDLAVEQVPTAGPLLASDGRGNLVLLSVNTRAIGRERIREFWHAGAVVDPETGCHALIRNPEPNMRQVMLRGIYQDSAVVAYRYREQTVEDGRLVNTYYDYANKVGIHPLRRVSGEPCEGMLPTVN